jgi:hypothetical protein
METVKVLKCKYCGKEDFKHHGALNLHLMHCERKYYKNLALKSNGNTKSIPEKETEKQMTKELQCLHEFRILVTNNPIERQAIQAGYKEVCEKCQELR